VDILISIASSIGGLVWSLVFLIVTLGILVVVHEYGHFFAARFFKVRVLRFSVGFGKVLWSRYDRQGTEFAVSMLPLGGYVQMLDEDQPGFIQQPEEDQRAASEPDDESLNAKPAWQRLIIAAGGPAANLLFAAIAFWLLHIFGMTQPVPYVGVLADESPAEVTGIQKGDLITAVDGKQTPSWSSVVLALSERLGDTGNLTISTRSLGANTPTDYSIPVNRWLAGIRDPDPLEDLGFEYEYPPAIMGDIVENSPADFAGFRPGDLVLAVDEEPVEHWLEWVERVREAPDRELSVLVNRQGSRLLLSLTPAVEQSGDHSFGRAGIQKPSVLLVHSPLEAVGHALGDTWDLSLLTLEFIKKMLVGLISPTTMGGPLAIADVAGKAAQRGIETFLYMLALLSVTLAVINLLPIPVLDGGHILFCLIEMVSRRPVSRKVQLVSFQVGTVLVLALMIFVILNDFSRYFF